jgi:hypothetical protein
MIRLSFGDPSPSPKPCVLVSIVVYLLACVHHILALQAQTPHLAPSQLREFDSYLYYSQVGSYVKTITCRATAPADASGKSEFDLTTT